MRAYVHAQEKYRKWSWSARTRVEAQAARSRFETLSRHPFRKLEEAHRKLPGDAWITGQRVFHLVERRDFARARTLAQDCRAEPSWCASLVGYVAHREGRLARADSAFSVVRRTMPEADRCRWEDLTILVEGDNEDEWYEGLDCAERAAVNDTLWWLADPLYVFPGNERKTAHALRHIYARLSRDFDEATPPSFNFVMGQRLHHAAGAVITADRSPGIALPPSERAPAGDGPGFPPCATFTSRAGDVDPLAAYVLAKGIPSFISRAPGKCFRISFPEPAYHFVPSLGAVRNPMRATAGAWDPDAPMPRESLHPQFGAFAALDHQLAWFRRAGVARVLAALDLAGNPVLRGPAGAARGVFSGIALSSGPGDTVRIYTTPIAGRADVFAVDAPSDSVLISLEGFAPGSGAARARYASGPSPMPSQRITISDLLLLDGSWGEGITALDTAALHAATSSRVTRDGTVGLFWEIYGVEAGDSVTYALSSAEGRVTSPIGRLGRALGVVVGDSASVQWTDHRRTGAAVAGQSIALSLSGMTAGKHLIRLQARVPGQQPVTVSCWIEIVDPGKD